MRLRRMLVSAFGGMVEGRRGRLVEEREPNDKDATCKICEHDEPSFRPRRQLACGTVGAD